MQTSDYYRHCAFADFRYYASALSMVSNYWHHSSARTLRKSLPFEIVSRYWL